MKNLIKACHHRHRVATAAVEKANLYLKQVAQIGITCALLVLQACRSKVRVKGQTGHGGEKKKCL